MTKFSLALIVLCLFVSGFIAGCTKNETVAEKTNLGLSEMTKAKDRGIYATVTETLSADPVCKWYKLSADVSHDVITLKGTVKTEEQKKHAEEVVLSIDLTRIKKENLINEIQVDPSLDDVPWEE